MTLTNHFSQYSHMDTCSIEQRYQLQREILSLSGTEIQVASVVNIDDLLDDLIQKGEDHEDVQDERIPYFADIWPSSIVLAAFILENKELVSGKDVLEVGCGIGLAGTAAGFAGATSVLQTDYLQEAIEFAEYIWEQNHRTTARTALLDWREPDLSCSRPLILAADVAYEVRNFRPLIDMFHQLLPENGTAILTEPSRTMARPFVQLLRESGFQVDTTIHPISFREMNYRIQLHILSHQKN